MNKMANEKRLFKVVWINKMVNGIVINPTTVKAKNIAGACKSVEKRDGCVAVISATMVTGPLMSDKEVETVEDYDEALR